MATHSSRPHITNIYLDSPFGIDHLIPIFSSIFSLPTLIASILIAMTTIIYDDFNFSEYWSTKNMCNLCSYLYFEVGVVTIMGMLPTIWIYHPN